MEIDRRSFIVGFGGTAAASLVDLGSGTATEAAQQRQSGKDFFDPDIVRGQANGDGEFQVKAKYWDGRLRLEVGDQPYQLLIHDGKIAEFRTGAGSGQPDVIVAGPVSTWTGGFALRGLRITGDEIGHIMPYYGAIYRLVTLMRETSTGPTPEEKVVLPEVDRQFDKAIGRYVYVRIQGVQCRVHFEEAGEGLPLMLQHTAGADGREWRQILEDTELQKHFRMIAYDLPYHGRSLPPLNAKWWAQDYILTKEWAMDSVLALAKALHAEGAVFMGCALGGELAVDLALYHPEAFCAVIAINSGFGGTTNPNATRASNDLMQHPRVFNTRRMGAQNYGNTSPNAPDVYRREIEWIYNQSGPGVFGGDLNYYVIEHDLRAGQAKGIDTSKVEVHFFSGEYCPSSLPEQAPALAAQIKGASYTTIKSANYILMSDDYPRFRAAVMPTLNAIAAKHGYRIVSGTKPSGRS